MTEAWYPAAEDYYVGDPDPDEYPVRQGDLFPAPAGMQSESGKPWHACLLIHPTCEVGAKTDPAKLHAVRVHKLNETSKKHQEAIARGYTEQGDEVRVAWAHAFFLPPAADLDTPMFANFRAIALVPREEFSVDRRIAALTHDARVFFIRRKLYWEQRWYLPFAAVQGAEGQRIGEDPAFIGEKPTWAITPN